MTLCKNIPYLERMNLKDPIYQIMRGETETERWDNLYARNAHLKCKQRIKWEEYRISIGRQELNWCQPYGDSIQSHCSFCKSEEEDEIHLYTKCGIINQYRSESRLWYHLLIGCKPPLLTTGPKIFGFEAEPGDTA